MAKLTTIRFLEPYYTADFGFTDLIVADASRTRTLCYDRITGSQVILQGHNFDYAGGMLTGGIIDKVTFTSDEGEPVETATNMHLDARLVRGDTMSDYFTGLSYKLFFVDLKLVGTKLDDANLNTGYGNDRLIGGAGDDTLSGAPGHDVLTGGSGNDIFVFSDRFDKDTVTDFDADGGAGFQDVIQATFADVESITQSGKNTIIDFGDGDMLTLLGVKKEQIDATDFV